MNLRCFTSVVVFAITSTLTILAQGQPANQHEGKFTGSETCVECHQTEFQEWQQSDHKKAMEVVSEDTVLGDFSGLKVTFHDIETRFFRLGKDYKVATLGSDGETGVFPVRYTFGHYPLQQYLVDIGNGRLQALNVAWDSRSAEEGGQRWFHLQADEDIDIKHPFFWAGYFQNWNSRCADCHSTDLQKNFDPDTQSYRTSWSEVSVGCEACHGPASTHVELANAEKLEPENSGFAKPPAQNLAWKFRGDDDIASPSGDSNSRHIDMCGGCHSRRSVIGKIEPLGSYHEQYRLALLDQGLYFSDGQINDEVYVLGSFLQSKMHQSGVTCNNCHNPHSGKVLADGNGLCLQCHKASAFDTPEHHRHKLESAGSQCVSCHMPERLYMSVDLRRDHSFVIPDPGFSAKSGVPNPCTSCHQDKSDSWAASAMAGWGVQAGNNTWAMINEGLAQQNMNAFLAYARNPPIEGLSSIRQATLLDQLAGFSSRLSMETAAKQLQDPEPLMRRAAVGALQSAPPAVRWQLLSPLIEDPVGAVRFEVATTVADVLGQLEVPEAEKLQGLLDEYRNLLTADADTPGGQVAMGILETQLGNIAAAEQAYQQALSIESSFVPAMINLSDLYRATERNSEAGQLLQDALAVAPDSATTYHAYGLFLVRDGRQSESLEYFRRAVEQEDAGPRHAYVYAIALDSLGRTPEAIKSINLADKRWPNNFDLSMLQVAYMDKTGEIKGIHHFLSLLASVAANAPQVVEWTRKYSGVKE